MSCVPALLSVRELSERLEDKSVRVVDCRFSLSDPDWGPREYERSHIPGAVYAHLERDLSGPVVQGRTGRHPLPDPQHFVHQVAGWGIHPDSHVVAYDSGVGIFAARLWWLMRWLGHTRVSVLDGGFEAWLRHDLPRSARIPRLTMSQYTARINASLVASTEQVLERVQQGSGGLVDARAQARYRGDEEPWDPVAGHIPSARCLPYPTLTRPDGTFLSPRELRDTLQPLLDSAPPDGVIAYCGSGVSACLLTLAAAIAGLPEMRLYPGSWSQWVTDPSRPVRTGEGA